jgi:hypothetical protein
MKYGLDFSLCYSVTVFGFPCSLPPGNMERSIDHGLLAKCLTTTGHKLSSRVEIYSSLLMFPSTGGECLYSKGGNTTRKHSRELYSIRRRLFESGFKRQPVSKNITIGPFNRERRLPFCSLKINWSIENECAKIIFSDEAKIEVIE